ncbi:uncharacterized protein LOC144097202 [Amblyomma americanum]
MVMAFASVASGILTLHMPETLAKHLPETVKNKENLFEFLPMHKISSKKPSRKGSQYETTLEWPMTPLMSASDRLPDSTGASKEDFWGAPCDDDKAKASETMEDLEAMLLQSAVELPSFLGPPRKRASKDSAAAAGEENLPPTSADGSCKGLSQPATSAPSATTPTDWVIPYGTVVTDKGATTASAALVQPESSSSGEKHQSRRTSKGSRTSSGRSRESQLGEAPPFSKYR